jgi:hypothetical protein
VGQSFWWLPKMATPKWDISQWMQIYNHETVLYNKIASNVYCHHVHYRQHRCDLALIHRVCQWNLCQSHTYYMYIIISFHFPISIIIPRGLSSALSHHIWYKGLFVLQIDIIVLLAWNKGPYGLLRLHGHLGLTYNSCCVVWGHSGLAVLHPYYLRMWVGYNRVQMTVQQGMVVMSPLYSLSIPLQYSVVLSRWRLYAFHVFKL